MKLESEPDEPIPPALLARVEALAAAEQRSAHDVVGDAVEHYLRERQAAADGARNGHRARNPWARLIRIVGR